MRRLYEYAVHTGRWLLETDLDDGIIFFGPLWLLWYGQWRKALRQYLPLALLCTVAHGLLSYGMAQNRIFLYRLGTLCILVCYFVGFAVNIWLFQRWNKKPASGRHFAPILLWLGGLYLMLKVVMWLGTVL